MPLSGADWACADEGMTPGSASAAASRPLLVTATAASADAVAARRTFLAGVDMLLRLGVETVVVELHLGLGEVSLLPGLGRLDCAGAERERGEDHDRCAHWSISRSQVRRCV